VKLWNYRCGEVLDSVDCTAYIDSVVDAAADCNSDVDSDSHHRSKDIRCMTCSQHLITVSFNGYLNFTSVFLGVSAYFVLF